MNNDSSSSPSKDPKLSFKLKQDHHKKKEKKKKMIKSNFLRCRVVTGRGNGGNINSGVVITLGSKAS